jgi:putative transcriptional regulator
VLHSLDWGGQDTIDVAGRWGLSGTVDVLRAIAAGKGPSRWLVALGYAGWTSGQLEEEMTRHGWFTTPATPDLIYDVAAADRWQSAFAGAGIDPRLLASSTGRA